MYATTGADRVGKRVITTRYYDEGSNLLKKDIYKNIRYTRPGYMRNYYDSLPYSEQTFDYAGGQYYHFLNAPPRCTLANGTRYASQSGPILPDGTVKINSYFSR